MTLYFLDTSALVKLYVQEPGTDRLLHLLNTEAAARFALVSLSVVEARSAIRRRQRAGDISESDADMVLQSLQRHIESRFVLQPANDSVIDAALQLIDRYTLRAYDAIQLGASLVLADLTHAGLTFVCSDRELLDAARSENIAVFDPAVSP